jgi:hypothetical protein
VIDKTKLIDALATAKAQIELCAARTVSATTGKVPELWRRQFDQTLAKINDALADLEND